MIGEEAIHFYTPDDGIDLKDGVGSIIQSETVEFVGQRHVENCHIQRLGSTDHICLRAEERSVRVDGIN